MSMVEIPGVGPATEGVCRSYKCRATIAWAAHPKTQKLTPWNLDGTSHFATCPDAPRFRRTPPAASRGRGAE